jgi:hypothetical protein
MLTDRITWLQQHVKKHNHDKAALRTLTTVVSRRRRLLRYMMKNDYASFRCVARCVLLSRLSSSLLVSPRLSSSLLVSPRLSSSLLVSPRLSLHCYLSCIPLVSGLCSTLTLYRCSLD